MIGECVESIRSNSDASDPVWSPDPIAFIGVFAIVLNRLVPEEVAWRCSDEIYELMGELVGIVVDEESLSWTASRKTCVEWRCIHFRHSGFRDPKLKPTLTKLVRTWDPEWWC